MNGAARRITVAAALAVTAALGPAAADPIEAATAAEQVRSRELGFARSMAERDFDAFAGFVADDAVFLNGGQPLRGKPAVLAHWKRFFDTPEAPFSWSPDLVESLADGGLAHSEGPVRAADGRVIARFYSTWRRDDDGLWRVVFDNGHDICPQP